MNILESKITSMVLLGVISLILGLLPIGVIKKLRWGPNGEGMSLTAKNLLSGLLCFGGGVLMATAFLHLLPEVHEGFEGLKTSDEIHTNLPIGMIVVCCGFFLVYLVEEVVHLIADRHAHNQTDVSLHRAVSIRACSVSRDGPAVPCEPKVEDMECKENSICQLNCVNKEYCRDVSVDEQNCSCTSVDHLVVLNEKDTSVKDNSKSNPNDCYGTFHGSQDDDHSDHDHEKANRMGTKKHSSHKSSLTKIANLENVQLPYYEGSLYGHQHKPVKNNGHHSHHHHGLVVGGHHCVGASLRGLLVIIALSLHEIFEGLAVGLQSNSADVWQLFAAVASHKYVISLCVGLELTTSGVRTIIHVIYILVFSMVTPLGIGIGIGLTSGSDGANQSGDSITSLVLQGLACGTLLYVAFFEILERERSKSTVGLLQLCLLVLGFLSILGLESIGGHDHHHGEEDGHSHDLPGLNITFTSATATV